MALFPWIGDQTSSLWGSLFGSSSPGAVGSSVYGPPGSAAPSQLGGLLDPQGIRQQAFFQGLGSLGQGLLAAGLPHPATQGSLIPQALGAFQPAYNAGIQSGGQMAALEQQAIDQQRMNALRASDPRYANLPTQALIAQASRPQARTMTPAEITAAGLTPGLPWQQDATGLFSVPAHDPRVLQAGSAATTQGRVGVEGYGIPQVGYIPPTAFRSAGTAVPGQVPATPAPAPGPAPPTARPPLPGQAGDDAGVVAAAGGRRWTAEDFGGNQQQADRANQQLDAATARSQPGRTAQPPRQQAPPQQAPPQQAPPQQAPPQPPSVDPLQPRVAQIPGMPGGTIIMAPSPQENQRQSREGTLTADDAHALAVQAQRSAAQVPLVQRQIQLLDRGLQTGSLADTRSAIAGAIRTIAGDNPAMANFANAIMNPDEAAFRAATGELVLARAGGSLGPGVSNTDAVRFEQLAPSIRSDPAAAREVAQILLRTSIANARDYHEMYSRSARNYDAATDPTTNQLRVLGRRNGVDFLTPDTPAAATSPPAPGARPPATAPPSARTPQRGDTATNPQTGARMEFDGIRWNLLPATR